MGGYPGLSSWAINTITSVLSIRETEGAFTTEESTVTTEVRC